MNKKYIDRANAGGSKHKMEVEVGARIRVESYSGFSTPPSLRRQHQQLPLQQVQ